MTLPWSQPAARRVSAAIRYLFRCRRRILATCCLLQSRTRGLPTLCVSYRSPPAPHTLCRNPQIKEIIQGKRFLIYEAATFRNSHHLCDRIFRHMDGSKKTGPRVYRELRILTEAACGQVIIWSTRRACFPYDILYKPLFRA